MSVYRIVCVCLCACVLTADRLDCGPPVYTEVKVFLLTLLGWWGDTDLNGAFTGDS